MKNSVFYRFLLLYKTSSASVPQKKLDVGGKPIIASAPMQNAIAGIGIRMPITAIAFCIGALAMIGLPPTSAFFGKMHIFSVAVLQKQYFVIFVLIVSTVEKPKLYQ